MKIPTWEEFKSEIAGIAIDKRKRVLLIAGSALLLGGFLFWLSPYLESLQGGNADIAAQRTRIAKYRQALKGRAELEGRLAAVTKALERGEAGLVTGKTAALAAADIQNTLKEITIGSGVEIKSMQIQKPPQKDTDPYLSVPVQFTISPTIRQLKDILYKIEAFPKFFLTVERVGISVAGAGGPGQIRCDVTVSGIMKNVKE